MKAHKEPVKKHLIPGSGDDYLSHDLPEAE